MTVLLEPGHRRPPGPRARFQPTDDDATIAVEVVVPVYNEQADLESSIRRLHAYLCTYFPFVWQITIADNASTDDTSAIAGRLAGELSGVRAMHLDQKGRGRALRTTWLTSEADVVAYMDVDLSTDLAALLPLVAPLLSGHSDLAIGSRLSSRAGVVRGPKRELISRCYNALLHALLGVEFSDAQCGFKAIRSDRARILLPHVSDNGWFFDTELLVLAERSGLRIHEVPVDWVDDPDSSVDVVSTALGDLRGIARLARGLATGALPISQLRSSFENDTASTPKPALLSRQLLRFAAVGVSMTLAYIALFVLLRPLGAQPANGLALLLTGVAGTAVHRWFTFGVRGRAALGRHHAQGLLVFALGWLASAGALGLLHAAHATPSRGAELLAILAANVLATAVRFVLLRSWVFRSAPGPKVFRSTATPKPFSHDSIERTTR